MAVDALGSYCCSSDPPAQPQEGRRWCWYLPQNGGILSDMQAPAVLDLLTESERRVVLLVAEGLTNPQIAARLFVSPQTVKTHMKNVFRKLKVSSRTELTALVVREDGGPAPR